jgi:heptosyltransferase II
LDKHKKILFVAEAQLGDLLLLTPALRSLKENIPGLKLTMLLMHRRHYRQSVTRHTGIAKSLYKGTAEVFLNNPYIDEVLEFDRSLIREQKGLKKINAELKCIGYLRKEKFDAVIFPFSQNRCVIWSFFARIPVRIGQKNQPFSRLINRAAEIEPGNAGVLKYYCGLLKPLGIETNDFSTIFNLTPEIKKNAALLLEQAGLDISKKIICIHPGASGTYKIWPAAYFAQIIDYLTANNTSQHILCSNYFDKPVADEICRLSSSKVNVITADSISELAGIISFSSLCIVNNSGPRHLAAALGIQTISLFNKHSGNEWKIYDEQIHPVLISEKECTVCPGYKCESKVTAAGKFGSQCMWEIKPEAVIGKINDILKKND